MKTIMKISVLGMLICMLTLIGACDTWFGPEKEETILILTAARAPYGIQLSTSVEANRGRTNNGNIKYDSPNPRVAKKDKDAVTIEDNTVAVLNIDTGVITPIGSSSETFLVMATDGIDTAELQVTTSIIDLAGANGGNHVTWLWTGDPQLARGDSTVSLTFYADTSEATIETPFQAYPSDASGYYGQLNKGHCYFEAIDDPNSSYMGFPPIAFSEYHLWEAIDGVFQTRTPDYCFDQQSGSWAWRVYPVEHPFPAIAFSVNYNELTLTFPAIPEFGIPECVIVLTRQ